MGTRHFDGGPGGGIAPAIGDGRFTAGGGTVAVVPTPSVTNNFDTAVPPPPPPPQLEGGGLFDTAAGAQSGHALEVGEGGDAALAAALAAQVLDGQ